MDISWPLLLLLLLLAWTVLVRIYEVVRKYPPSCIGVPLLGRVPMLALRSVVKKSDFYSELARDGASKGSVWCSFLGTRRIVGLTSYDAIFDALSRQGQDFAWRPPVGDFTSCRMLAAAHGSDPAWVGGIVFSSGELWRGQRRFALSVMRDLGMGKNLTERKIQVEAKCLSEELRALGGAAVAPNRILTKAVSNIISQFVFGIRSAYDSCEFDEFNCRIKKITQEGDAGLYLTLLFPALENSLLTKGFSKKYAEHETWLIEFISDQVSRAEARTSKDTSSEPEHFVEAFLRRQASEPEAITFCRRQLVLGVYDLFTAGSETTSTFLNWAVLYLSVYRDWQQALQEEVDEELGSLSNIAFGDRIRCHKTMAFIDEIQRHATIVPHGVAHSVNKECFLHGYRIPKDAYVIPDIRSVHYDPELWHDPHRFDPGRFLKASGEYQANKFLIPFGLGKRVCLGESLARMEIFIFLTSIVKSFEVDLDAEAKALKDRVFVGNSDDVHGPKNHKVIFTPRKEGLNVY